MRNLVLLLLSVFLLGCEPCELAKPVPPTPRTTIVALHAPWCGACKTMYPRWNILERRGHIVERHNIDDGNPWGVRVIPATIIYREGKELARFEGLATVSEIEAVIAAR